MAIPNGCRFSLLICESGSFLCNFTKAISGSRFCSFNNSLDAVGLSFCNAVEASNFSKAILSGFFCLNLSIVARTQTQCCYYGNQ